MWPAKFPPKIIHPNEATRVPARHRRMGHSEHSINQKRGKQLDCFIEGPVILDNVLFVTDIPYGRIFAIDLTTKEWRTIIEYDGEPNGMAWHSQRKRIVIADFKKGLLELDPDTARLTSILTRFNGEAFKGLNDVIVSSRGDIFFTDQGMSGLQDPSGRVFRFSHQGTLDVLLRNCPSPNGLVLDKFESTLFVAMTRDNSVWHVPLYADGSVQRTGRFSTYYGMGGPDGMTTDTEGNVFVAHSSLGSVFVHRASGEPLARIDSLSGQGITNLSWGGNDGRKLYITESQEGSILEVDWHCPGLLCGRPAPEFH